MKNTEVACFMLKEKGLNRGSHITGKSVHNQRMEHLWCDVNRVIVSKAVNFDHHGIDEEGPVPDIQSDYSVSVPDTITTLTHNQELPLQEARDAAFKTGDHDGIIACQVVLQIASFYLNCCS